MKRIFIGLLGLGVLSLFCFLLVAAISGGSAGGTLRTGRTIMASSDSIYLTASFGRDTGTTSTSGKTIVVRPKSIQINGKTVATIDEANKSIQVLVKRGHVSFLADGQPVNIKMPRESGFNVPR